MISEKIAGIYSRAEDKYFDLLDFLDSKGLPVYTYSDFFENKGIPSFVVTLAILLLILVILTVALTYRGPDVGELKLSLKDAEGNSLNNVTLKIVDEKNNTLFEGKANDGQAVKLSRGLYNREKITITAEADGYQPATIKFTIGQESNIPKLSFDKEFEGIEAKVRLVDAETKTIVNEALVIASSRNEMSYQFNEDTNGIYKKTGVPAGVSLILKVTAEGYNTYEDSIVFNANQVREIQLTPSSAGFVGKANVAISVKGPDGKLVDGAKVTVSNKQNNTVELSDFTRSGGVIGLLTAGVPLRIVAEKAGYLTYDSDTDGAGITIRQREQQIIINLKQGGQKLVVSAIDAQSSFSVDGATVQIFRLGGELIESKTTTVSGAEFSGLNPSEEVFITAQKEGYLPSRQKILVGATEEVKVIMQRVTPTNSARLDIYSIDSKGNSVNAVNVEILEKTAEGELPSGIPLLQTSLAGYVNAVVESGKTFALKGYTDVLESDEVVVEMTQGKTDEKIYLKMSKKPNVVEMVFVDVFGNDILGNAVVSGLDGETLYDGNIRDSRVFFDSQQRETVEVMVNLFDGNEFVENVYVKGKDYVEVTVYSKNASTLSPVIEFVGIETEDGESVKGITPGAFYWAKFNVVYPRAAKSGGVHFRTGQDSVTFAESEKLGLFDLSMQGAEVAYSVSYTPEPKPGNEVVDRANFGAQGEKNKWIEGTLKEPKGNYVAKVKIRAEDFSAGKMVINYRAWAVVGSEYYRAPEDTIIGTNPFSEGRAGLYAETKKQDIVLYESLPECTDTICMAVKFIDDKENVINENGFEALKGKNYALEVEITSQEQDYLQITALSETVEFNSTQSGNLSFVRESGFEATEGKKEAAMSLSLAKEGKQKIRFYFTGKEEGNASIFISAKGKSTVEKEVLFKVVEEKTLLVELSEEQVIAGRNFTVRVTDSGLSGIENALVKILDKEGKVVKSIVGDGTDGKGKTGYYRVQNNLSVGLYSVEVSAPGFKTTSVALLITTQDVLSFPEELEAKIPFNQKTILLAEELFNNSEFIVQNITVETTAESEEDTKTGESVSAGETGKFKINVVAPSALGANSKQTVQITVAYSGAADSSAEENATITISGLVEGKFLTKATAELRMVYNQQLDPSCLKLEPTSLSINLLGTEGATDSEIVEVTNNCDQEIFLKHRVREKTKKSYIIVTAEDIVLQAGETKNITITANNLIARANSREQTFGYEVVYDSNYLKKTINVSVKVIDPLLALSYPPQITLWLAQSTATEKATAAQPIMITNISSFPVENIQLKVDRDYGAGANVQLSIEPGGAVNLEKGQAIVPPKVLFAQANSKISEPVKGRIEITGKLGNLNNSSGQNDRYGYYEDYYSGKKSIASYSPKSSPYYNNTSQVLGMIDVTAIYSGYDCLKAGLVSDVASDFMFPTNGGQMGKLISIRNLCAEPVIVTGASPGGYTQPPTMYGMPTIASSIIMSVPQVSLAPGTMIQVPLTIITAIPNLSRKNYQVVVNAVSQISQVPIQSKPFGVNIYSGVEISDEVSRTVKVNAKLCTVEGTKEIEINVPKVTQESNCGEQYCDAVGAAKYLAKQIRQTIKNAQSAGYSKKNDAEAFNCQVTGACTFEEVGLTVEPFSLYLQNDALTSDLLSKELNNEAYEGVNSTPFRETIGSTGFMVIPQIVDIAFLRQTVLTGYDRMVFLDTELRGCGYYKVRITGAFKAAPDGLDVMTPALSVQLMPINESATKKLVTKECRTSITNILNFNPIDKELNPGKDYGTWLTTIEADELLKQVAKDVSNKRFGTTERVSSGSGNKVRITYGALQGALAQACITGSDKRTITVTIDQGISNALDTKTRDVFAQSVVKMISDTLAGAFGDNCLVANGETYSCVKLTDSASVGKRQMVFQGKNEITFTSNEGGCALGTIYSNIPEILDFEVTTISPSAAGKEFANVRKISIVTDDAQKKPNAVFKTDTTTAKNNSSNEPTNNSTTAEKTPAQPFGEKTTTPASPSATAQENENYLKASFAEQPASATGTGVAPTTPAQTNMGEVVTENKGQLNISAGEIYSVIFEGGTLKPKTASQSMTLLPNPTSKQYKFYRNIKVCAYPSDDEGRGAGNLAYLLANGVQFEVALIKKSTGETQDAKQTMTILTGTIHPEDLLKKYLSGEMKKGTVYKFVPMWEGTPEAINTKLYYELLVNSRKLDNYSGGGNAKTEKDMQTETNARASSLNKYVAGCLPTALACNLVTDGIYAAAFSSMIDCAAPLYGPLKKDALATPWGKTILKGTEGILNFFGGMIEKLLGVFGIKVDLKLNFTSQKTEARELTAETAKVDSGSVAAYGAIAGVGAEVPKIIGWQGPGYALSIANQRSINYVADEMAKAYRKSAEDTLTASLETAWRTDPANAGRIKTQLDAYEAVVKKKIQAGLRAKLDEAWKRKMLGTRYVTPGVDLDVKAALSEGLKTEKLGFGEFLSTKTGTATMTPAQELFGSATGSTRVFADTEMAASLKKGLGLVESEWTEKLRTIIKGNTNLLDADDLLKEGATITGPQLDNIVEKYVDEVAKGLPDTTKNTIKTNVKTAIAGRVYYGKETVAITSKISTVKINNGLADIVNDIESASKAELRLALSGKQLKGAADDVAKALGKSTDDLLKGAAEEVGKSKTSLVMRNLFSLRTLKLVAWSAGCGAVAPLVGMQFYDDAISDFKKQDAGRVNRVDSKIIEKGKLYKAIVDEFEGTLLIFDGKDEMDLEKKNGADKTIALMSGVVDGKTPEQRGIGVYLLRTGRNEVRNLIAENTNDFLDYYAQGDQKKILESAPMQRFQNDTLKEIVYRLTARKTLDCKDRTPKINDTAGYGALVEPIAFAIATTRAASNAYTTRELTDEYNGKGNWLEDRVQKAVEARATVDTVNGVTHLKMTKEAAKKIFPEANDEVLERFVDDYALWEKAYDTSPDLSSLCVK